jgi:mono/diheme cytochrome c family protein
MVWLVTVSQSGAHDEKPHAAKGESEHIHAPVPADFATVKAPSHIWTEPAVLVRGQAIYMAKCAVCHGTEGAGDGADATWLGPKMGSFRDRAMVAEMSDAYWFWRVSEGGTAEPYRSKGSVMPAYKDALSVEDRWAVIAYQHAQSEHAGPHIASEHPEMEAGPRPHPEPRGIGFSNQWVTRDHRWQPRGPWKWAVMRALPQLYREFNGIDFGHAHLAETLLRPQNPQAVETARLEVLTFIFSSPSVPPDEEQVAPTFNRMAWEVAKTFDWAHLFHRSLYDLHAVTRTSTGLCLTERWYLARGLPRVHAHRGGHARLFNRALDPLHRVDGHRQGADQLARLPQLLNHPEGRRLAQKIDHGPCWTRLGHRPEHERAHDAGVAIAIVMEVLIELLLLIGGVTVAAALLPLQPKVRLVLSFCGLVLVTVGGALFAFVTYPGETLLFVGAGAGIAGTAW